MTDSENPSSFNVKILLDFSQKRIHHENALVKFFVSVRMCARPGRRKAIKGVKEKKT